MQSDILDVSSVRKTLKPKPFILEWSKKAQLLCNTKTQLSILLLIPTFFFLDPPFRNNLFYPHKFDSSYETGTYTCLYFSYVHSWLLLRAFLCFFICCQNNTDCIQWMVTIIAFKHLLGRFCILKHCIIFNVMKN